jgi:hypothetical protein
MLEAALDYHGRLGWKVIRVNGKNPSCMGAAWEARTTTEEDIRVWFGNGATYNLGVQWGPASKNTADVDLDTLAAVLVADSFLPPTKMVYGRLKHLSSHRIYTLDAPGKNIKLVDPILKKAGNDRAVVVELRCNNLMTVVPPSVHEKTQEVIAWELFEEATPTTYAELVRAVHKVGAAALLARYWPIEGARHDRSLELGGALAHAGYPVEDAVQLVRAIAHATKNDDEVEDRVRAVTDSYKGLEQKKEISGWPILVRSWGEDKVPVLQTVWKWLGLEKPSKQAQGNDNRGGEDEDLEDGELVVTCLAGVMMEPYDWLVEGYILLGKLAMLAGDGGHGKSTLLLHLAACLSRGVCAFGLKYPNPLQGDTLIIQCEDDVADTLVPRLRAAGADMSRIHQVEGVRNRKGKVLPFNLACYQMLEQELERRPEVRLVIIDPAGAYIGRIDDHKDSELRGLLAPLAVLAAKKRVCIILVKHLNKGVSLSAVHRINGSVGYVNSVRSSIVVAPDPDDPKRKLFLPLKINLGELPPARAYRFVPPNEAEREKILLNYAGHLDDKARERLSRQLIVLEWEDASLSTTAEEVFAEARQKAGGPKDVDLAAVWLGDFLAGGPKPSDLCVAQGNKDLGMTHNGKWWRESVLRPILHGKPKLHGFGSKGVWYFTLPSHPWPPPGTVCSGAPDGGVVLDNDQPERPIIPFPGRKDSPRESHESRESQEKPREGREDRASENVAGGEKRDSLDKTLDPAESPSRESQISTPARKTDALPSLPSLEGARDSLEDTPPPQADQLGQSQAEPLGEHEEGSSPSPASAQEPDQQPQPEPFQEAQAEQFGEHRDGSSTPPAPAPEPAPPPPPPPQPEQHEDRVEGEI